MSRPGRSQARRAYTKPKPGRATVQLHNRSQEGLIFAYAFVQDIASSWEHYERVAAQLNEPPPPGLILHLAGPTDEGFRIIAIWETEAAWQAFRAERVQTAIAALGGPSRPEPTFRDLHAAHMVLGTIRSAPRH